MIKRKFVLLQLKGHVILHFSCKLMTETTFFFLCMTYKVHVWVCLRAYF